MHRYQHPAQGCGQAGQVAALKPLPHLGSGPASGVAVGGIHAVVAVQQTGMDKVNGGRAAVGLGRTASTDNLQIAFLARPCSHLHALGFAEVLFPELAAIQEAGRKVLSVIVAAQHQSCIRLGVDGLNQLAADNRIAVRVGEVDIQVPAALDMTQHNQLTVLVSDVLCTDTGNRRQAGSAAVVRRVRTPLDRRTVAVLDLEAVVSGLGEAGGHTSLRGRLVEHTVHNQRPASVLVHNLHAGIL